MPYRLTFNRELSMTPQSLFAVFAVFAVSLTSASLASAATTPPPEQIRAEIRQSLAMLHDAVRGNREELFGTIVDVDRFQLVTRFHGLSIKPTAGHFPFQDFSAEASRPEFFATVVDADTLERWLESRSAVLDIQSPDRVEVHVGGDILRQRIITLARRDWGWQVVNVAIVRWAGC
jgi:hypothetical protein